MDSITVIPEELEAEFQVAIHMHGSSTDEWSEYCAMYRRATRHLNYSDGLSGTGRPFSLLA